MSGLEGLGAHLRTWSVPEVGSREGEVTQSTTTSGDALVPKILMPFSYHSFNARELDTISRSPGGIKAHMCDFLRSELESRGIFVP
jgi:hypothetical protein